MQRGDTIKKTNSSTKLPQFKADKIGKAAYNPVVKDLIGSRPTLEKVEEMINEPMKSRGIKKGLCQTLRDSI